MEKTYRIAPEIKREILSKIKDKGLTVKDAETQCGVSEKTIYGWLPKGVEGQPTWSQVNKLKRENQQLLSLVGELTVKLCQAPIF